MQSVLPLQGSYEISVRRAVIHKYNVQFTLRHSHQYLRYVNINFKLPFLFQTQIRWKVIMNPTVNLGS